MKTCKNCGLCKEDRYFGKDKTQPDGLAFYCKSCKSTRGKNNYMLNKDKIKILVKNYRKEQPEKVKRGKRKEYIKNKQRYIETSNRYYYKNKEEISASRKTKYYSMTIEQKKEKNKKLREKRKTDILWKLKANLRSRLSNALKNENKRGSAVKNLGCSIFDLKLRFESLFKPGMTWLNYGFGPNKWNIDHIKPLSLFDLTKKDDLLQACHFSNLQPMWHLENVSKGCKYKL